MLVEYKGHRADIRLTLNTEAIKTKGIARYFDVVVDRHLNRYPHVINIAVKEVKVANGLAEIMPSTQKATEEEQTSGENSFISCICVAAT